MNSDNLEIEKAIATLENVIKKRREHIQEARHSAVQSPLPYLFTEMLNRAEVPFGHLTKIAEQGTAFVRQYIHTADENIKERPWQVLRTVAVYSFGVGMFLSLRFRKKHPREK